MDNAFKWIVKNRGIDREDDWPYEAEAGKCGFFARRRRAAQIDGFADVPPGDESALEKAVAVQPVSVAIEADHRSFQLYAGGVFASKDCGTQLDHGVLVVGYGRRRGGPSTFGKSKTPGDPNGARRDASHRQGGRKSTVRSGDAARVPQRPRTNPWTRRRGTAPSRRCPTGRGAPAPAPRRRRDEKKPSLRPS